MTNTIKTKVFQQIPVIKPHKGTIECSSEYSREKTRSKTVQNSRKCKISLLLGNKRVQRFFRKTAIIQIPADENL